MNGFIKTILIILLIVSFNHCKKETPPTIPYFNIKFVLAGGMDCYSTISNDGGSGIVEHGFKWKTDQEADYQNDKIAFENSLNYFETIIYGLSPNTTYYVKAYATNSEGTGFSEEKVITTSKIGTFTDTRDGKTYKWVEIGNQTWMAQNLAYLPYVSPFTNDTGIFVYNYKGSSADAAKNQKEFKTYGCLYSWDISLKVCPDGWHLPSDDEWQDLERYIGMTLIQISQYGDYKNIIPGNLLKSTEWSGLYGGPKPTNATLFSALPGGQHFHDTYNNPELYFNYLGTDANFWSSPRPYEIDDFQYMVKLNYDGIVRFVAEKTHGFSVRCIKD